MRLKALILPCLSVLLLRSAYAPADALFGVSSQTDFWTGTKITLPSDQTDRPYQYGLGAQRTVETFNYAFPADKDGYVVWDRVVQAVNSAEFNPQLGNLGVAVGTNTYVDNTHVSTTSTIDGHLVTYTFDYLARAQAHVSGTAEFHDALTIHSDILPVGSPVKLSLRLHVDGTLIATHPEGVGMVGFLGPEVSADLTVGTGGSTRSGDLYFGTSAASNQESEISQTTSFVFTALVGDTIPLSGTLTATAESLAGSPDGSTDRYMRDIRTASTNALFNVDVLPPDSVANGAAALLAPEAWYTSASGTDYSIAALPEPGALMAALPVLIFGLLRPRRQRRM